MLRTHLQREQFLLDILAEPERDDLRLIYADWQQEQGRENHAALIRVQVELAQLKEQRIARSDPDRKALRRREMELLALPEFGEVTLDERKGGLQYERGFVSRGSFDLLATEEQFLGSVPGPDRILGFRIEPPMSGSASAGHLARLHDAWWLPRVRGFLVCNNWGQFYYLDDIHLEELAEVPGLRSIDEFFFFEAHVPLRGLERLIASGTAPLESIELSGWPLIDGRDYTGTEPHPAVEAFFVFLASQPRAAGLQTLRSDLEGVGEAALVALLNSPYLGALRTLKVRPSGNLSDGVRQALQERWPAAV
jgi:uncharacterized protein (TIGR02996 family)